MVALTAAQMVLGCALASPMAALLKIALHRVCEPIHLPQRERFLFFLFLIGTDSS